MEISTKLETYSAKEISNINLPKQGQININSINSIKGKVKYLNDTEFNIQDASVQFQNKLSYLKYNTKEYSGDEMNYLYFPQIIIIKDNNIINVKELYLHYDGESGHYICNSGELKGTIFESFIFNDNINYNNTILEKNSKNINIIEYKEKIITNVKNIIELIPSLDDFKSIYKDKKMLKKTITYGTLSIFSAIIFNSFIENSTNSSNDNNLIKDPKINKKITKVSEKEIKPIYKEILNTTISGNITSTIRNHLGYTVREIANMTVELEKIVPGIDFGKNDKTDILIISENSSNNELKIIYENSGFIYTFYYDKDKIILNLMETKKIED